MRDLTRSELEQVSGGVGDPIPHDNRDQAKWGNNGFGNGADFNNDPPGASGLHEPLHGNGQSSGKRDSRGDDQGPR
jgi:hypothetical protein